MPRLRRNLPPNGGLKRDARESNREPRADTPEFWFMMQIAMLCGFVTSYPVNWWLIRAGIKERM